MDLTKVQLKNMTQDEIIEIAEYLDIPMDVSLTTAFDGGLVNIMQIVDAGNATITKFVSFLVASIDPYPAKVRRVRFHLDIIRELYGDTSRQDHGNIGPITGVSFAALDEYNFHLGKLKSLIPFQCDETFMARHTSFPRFVGRGS
jgi:hypothetical protein